MTVFIMWSQRQHHHRTRRSAVFAVNINTRLMSSPGSRCLAGVSLGGLSPRTGEAVGSKEIRERGRVRKPQGYHPRLTLDFFPSDTSQQSRKMDAPVLSGHLLSSFGL